MNIVVIGGSGSGKSEFAENLAVKLNRDKLIYIATMQPFGEEGKKRIERHQQLRQDKNFQTIECYTNLSTISIPQESTVLLECVSNLVANEMFSNDNSLENKLDRQGNTLDKQENTLDRQGNTLDKQENTLDRQENTLDKQGNTLDKQENTLDRQENTLNRHENTLDRQENTLDKQGNILDKQENTLDKKRITLNDQGNYVEKVTQGIRSIIRQADNLIIVTNNVFEDGFRYDDTTMLYMKELGQINQQICLIADQMIEVIHGIPVYIKGYH
ncbi:MAG: Adenosyl cobinamide kinase/adenosyl cobinamide phosphate guanylyltransferase [Herbinix sp.]|nr:Adenosyl cobinamide kinase/adenosyl cobinamide phosphate guanylyltransferase [Herbinix sp.]